RLPKSVPALYRLQRRAEGDEFEEAVSRRLARQAGAGGRRDQEPVTHLTVRPRESRDPAPTLNLQTDLGSRLRGNGRSAWRRSRGGRRASRRTEPVRGGRAPTYSTRA